ncbi:MAG TPA: hypothetical protein VFT22_16475, partial [Kofleriaceae bacterium]|nr:hypothetical protein [Kofleriaceae bacterium]
MTQTSGLFILVGVALATAGCGDRKHSPLEGETKIEGALVVLQVSCIGEQNVEALGRKGRCYDATPYQFRIPASVLGAGRHTVKVTGTKDSSPPVTITIEVEVDVPEAALAAVLSVERCAESGTDVRVNARRDLACKLAPDASVKLVIDASPKAKLTFDGDVIDVPDSGLVEPRVDLGKRFIALAIDELSAV